ncbi:hypothetical protein PJZ01_001805 [Listeria innocua]|uniref:hypothetical protein n=1 Tax=Listeria innocua TaxID=1642 RepID=UPI0010DA96BF|nr:hypothetical protein [Listeria innocua]EJQ0570616.1 hypothetical protein [Listeria innocua]EKF1878306.1 hypothetical protein [Listeria innocua]EKJ8907982.1 hypothetical protein [Listeria innocua]EKJ8910753.1 hypothetical protein [Listeria innocua]EKJ8915333.1 hypothetical protein [Listeria innocua]
MKKKKCLLLILAATLILTVTTISPSPASAFIPCSQGGKHSMRGNGLGYVKNVKTGKYPIHRKQAYRCTKCSMVIVSVNNVYAKAKSLGKYQSGTGPDATVQVILQRNNKLYNNTSLTKDPFTQGMVFYR